MNLPHQHLSDEAIAAYVDGVLGSGARTRAARHVGECADCAAEVAVQREAVWALRAAPAPALPLGLLDRLRELPTTTPLSPSVEMLAPDGSAVFPAYGTSTEVAQAESRAWQPSFAAALVPTTSHPRFSLSSKRAQHAVIATAAIAFVSIGMAASSSAASTAPSLSQPASHNPASVAPADFLAPAGSRTSGSAHR
jgi:anti-sigma factor RsiW